MQKLPEASINPNVPIPENYFDCKFKIIPKALHFGDDTRQSVQEILNVIPEIRNRVNGVACMMRSYHLRNSQNLLHGCLSALSINLTDKWGFSQHVPTLDIALRERFKFDDFNGEFKNELAPGFGTAFLIGKKHVLTAAHCVCDLKTREVLSDHELRQRLLVFDFTEVKPIGEYEFASVYKISKVVSKIWKPRIADWAILELDRDVTNRNIITLDTQVNFSETLTCYILGHPDGLPMKYATGFNNRLEDSNSVSEIEIRPFKIDAFMGNSGSPILSQKSNDAVAMLVGGTEDYEIINELGKEILSEAKASDDRFEECQIFLPDTFTKDLISVIQNPGKKQSTIQRIVNAILSVAQSKQTSDIDNSIINPNNLRMAADLLSSSGNPIDQYNRAYLLFHTKNYLQANQILQDLSKRKDLTEQITRSVSTYKTECEKRSRHDRHLIPRTTTNVTSVGQLEKRTILRIPSSNSNKVYTKISRIAPPKNKRR